ncbi:MAG: LCP family protein [Limosilactobacillus sp.]|jgi:LCP family protein required for cell wall assembly|uniref:LCP family protein n=1 Tax=Limosilactobacillus sp. TaxID=2773925 RepID=UPI0025BA5AFF|nr:LCP family protein [Limosilactobacillus sp.]MCI1974914.1 LCP family protein [Limosilactobacillus sp.]MCI2030805.1 LCP family protein [Limosilactobacillus sp.]
MNNQSENEFPLTRAEYQRRIRCGNNQGNGNGPRNHRGRKIFGIIILILLILVAIFGGLAWYNAKQTSDQMFTSAGATKRRNAQKVLEQKRPVSILLLGTDTGDLGRTYKGRTDTIMVMTVNPQTKKTTLMSIPRDMKVNLPGYEDESPAKINAAYAYGGTKETINTVQKYFNIPIDYYALVNMAGMKQAINQVGGVTVTSPLTFTYEGYSFTKGVSEHMNGTKALKFCRMRYDDPKGDYGRQQRQKMVIMALLKKSASYKTVLNQKFLKTVSKNAHTDLTFDNMMTLAKSYRQATKNIQQGHVQGTDDDSDGQSFQDVSYNERQRVSNTLRKSLGLEPVDIDE